MHIDMTKPIVQETVNGDWAVFRPHCSPVIVGSWDDAMALLMEEESKITDPIECIVSSALREHFSDSTVERAEVDSAISMVAKTIARVEESEAWDVARKIRGS